MRKRNVSGQSSSFIVKDTGVILLPDSQRVILRSFIPFNESQIERIISRVMALEESDVERELKGVLEYFSNRHRNFMFLLEHQFDLVHKYMSSGVLPSQARRQLIGSFFLGEYSFESAALFNPSIVPHPDQSGMSSGSLRFIISLRATGEGHISSLTFRSGIINAGGSVSIDDIGDFASTAKMKPNALYDKSSFTMKLHEMGVNNDFSNSIINSLPEKFTIDELRKKLKSWIFNHPLTSQTDRFTSGKILWLARCNYDVNFDPNTLLSERVLFPLSPSEQNGIEDARFVLFTDDAGKKKYYATYTAYDGKTILPQLIETEDFVHFKMITLNGSAAVNKGMALFPKKINGHYAMISRQDNENLFLMYSDNIHFWHETVPLMKPSYPWEFVQIGTCSSPIETEHGWLLLTHGVGPLRQYSISAILLDKKDPSRVIGRLRNPLIRWTEPNRAGYVPNVVYTCGMLLHKDTLVIPYAMSDQKTTISLFSLSLLIERLLQNRV